MALIQITCDRSYPVVHPEMVDAIVHPEPPSCEAEPFAVELREISPASAKLLMAGPPQLPSRCRLRLNSSKLVRALELPAEIGWARPNLAGDWLVECEFAARIGEPRFDELLGSGLLERRSAVRYQTRIPVAVEWTLGENRVAGLVRDLSEGGLCLMTSLPPEGRVVYVLATTQHGEAVLQLKVRWSLSVGENHLIGCQFIRGEDFYLLRNLQPAVQPLYNEYSRAARPSNS
jgi:hypothetical protein